MRCVHAHVEPRVGQAPRAAEGFRSLAWAENPIPVSRPDGGRLYLQIDQLLQLGTDPDYAPDLKYFTRSYFYGVLDAPEADPLVYWHWNPASPDWPYPHVHAPLAIGAGMELHIPTGQRVTVEQVVRFLIEEKLVVPVCSEEAWRAALSEGQQRFEAFQTQEPRRSRRPSN